MGASSRKRTEVQGYKREPALTWSAVEQPEIPEKHRYRDQTCHHEAEANKQRPAEEICLYVSQKDAADTPGDKRDGSGHDRR